MESNTIPQCDICQRNLRPNILLWNDLTYIPDRSNSQKTLYQEFIWDQYYWNRKILIIEIGAGIQYQAIRCISEDLLDKFGPKAAKLVRINPNKGYNSVFGDHAVNFIDQHNYEQKIKEDEKDIEIMHIENTAL